VVAKEMGSEAGGDRAAKALMEMTRVVYIYLRRRPSIEYGSIGCTKVYEM
jgi:hypothetical protein